MISNADIIVRLLLGTLLGGIIGFERQTHGRPAGFRTHLLVCVASVLIMIVSEYYHFLSLNDPSYVRIDPARLAAGAITGVGFLGAGVIVKTGVTVQGLTTAACLWIVSAIGLSIGSGLYVAGVLGFVITYFSLWTLRMVEKKMARLDYKFVKVVMKGKGDEEAVAAVITRNGAHISRMNYERDLERGESVFDSAVSLSDDTIARKIFDELSSLELVKKIEIRS